jgi:carbamoyl-phosphate synthase large subunit
MAMALGGGAARSQTKLFLSRLAPRTQSWVPARTFKTDIGTVRSSNGSHAKGQSAASLTRFLSSSAVRGSSEMPNQPSAKAYIDSGVIKTASNPVNVKKVLVIGSGGLAIGQAGEFDYSGMFLDSPVS